MRINIGSAIKRALQQVVENQVQLKSGLYVPPDYIAGKHFGGFTGYEPWIQECIRACCLNARGIGPDELSEISALAVYQDPPEPIFFTILKHSDTMRKLDLFLEPFGGLSVKLRDQIQKVDGMRERGTLMVIAVDPRKWETERDISASVSAWNPASVEEAESVPQQRYAGSGWGAEREELRKKLAL